MPFQTLSRALAPRAVAAILGLAAIAVPTAGALAQPAYPSKPIRLIVPFPPGGGTDMIARTVAQKLADQNQWNVVVDNRPGAGGNLGVDAAAKSAPDGYTLVMGQTSNLAINPSLYAKLPYDPLKDLVPVALVSSSPIVMAAPAKSPYKTFADVVAAAKAKPDGITLGFSGNGTVAHLAGELAENAAGIQLRHVPYKGAAQAMTDLVGGQIDLYMSSVPTLLGQVRNGKLRAIVLTSTKRSAQLPDTPTLEESGYKGFEAVTWFGVLAPAGTPAAIVQQLNKAINRALEQPDVAEKLRSEGGEVLGGSPEKFSNLLRTDVPRWAQIVKASGASLD
ncbi:MAG: tripartite tricarboxylate transporter substrate binding protein [Diaphorobacter nitroreducens]|uniref:Tripartite-type tricarboxylate transporter receptor subunit TctC n=1 Tax=Diaphorobacter nitroreducens TaxID=164759 RepID=A0AAX1WW53_9BURK|nr:MULTISPECIES: tripartite tricarboxylate transporter substrate binding protein [Diaphorobacter]MBV2218535.1 tripartite tricarboxylate transporter substrate binding protein [Diaphorobacter sp.]ROR48897.1 tripartite-type tricarboxylate transporter receptor subunit TctC [Diaphorobacter nitroreducens]WKK89129.1 tripartite tricarboxylate transporter substrate binding protein [Diaphorobacter sp. C33]